MKDEGARVVLVTVPDVDVGVRLARTLLERELVACVNVVPGVRSLYRWEGEIQDDAEVLLVIKTEATVLDALCEVVVAEHPYSVPEFIALPIVAAHAPYRDWMRAHVKEPDGKR